MIYEVREGKEEELDDLFSTISSSSGVLCIFSSWAHVAAGEEIPLPADLCAGAFAPCPEIGKIFVAAPGGVHGV